MQNSKSIAPQVGFNIPLIFLLVLICPGCVYISHQKYPETHKFMPEKGGQCIKIAGIYNNQNSPVKDKRLFYKDMATTSLAPSFGFLEQSVDKVKISQDDLNALEIAVLDDQHTALSKKIFFRNVDYECKNGRIIFRNTYPNMWGLMGQPIYNSNHYEITKTFDGDLVLGDFRVGFNILIIPPLPILTNESALYFFRKNE